MPNTQDHLLIKDIANDIVLLRDGGAALVIETSAVNFDLLSENEQLAIISSFAGLLNSLNFAIQIVIRSKRLDISKYLENLEREEKQQQNPLLKNMMSHYRSFVANTISENDVLDKQFFIVIPLSSLELGVNTTVEKNLQKALTILNPRKDAIVRLLARIGLKSTQLDNEKLARLFFDIYNESALHQINTAVKEEKNSPSQTTSLTPNTIVKPVSSTDDPKVIIPPPPVQTTSANTPNVQPIAPAINPQVNRPNPYQATIPKSSVVSRQLSETPKIQNYPPRVANTSSPFVVEELSDDYTSA